MINNIIGDVTDAFKQAVLDLRSKQLDLSCISSKLTAFSLVWMRMRSGQRAQSTEFC